MFMSYASALRANTCDILADGWRWPGCRPSEIFSRSGLRSFFDDLVSDTQYGRVPTRTNWEGTRRSDSQMAPCTPYHVKLSQRWGGCQTEVKWECFLPRPQESILSYVLLLLPDADSAAKAGPPRCSLLSAQPCFSQLPYFADKSVTLGLASDGAAAIAQWSCIRNRIRKCLA